MTVIDMTVQWSPGQWSLRLPRGFDFDGAVPPAIAVQPTGFLVGEAAAAAEKLGTSLKLAKPVAMGKGWRRDARREGALPAGLFEVIRFKDSEIAH